MNSRDSKKAILYARVSTQEQAEKGYSLAQQLEALRTFAASQGYKVLEEITDAGHSGATLDRPGLDRVRELVEAGGVSAVLGQDRDRFAREPAYHFLLNQEFEKHGCKLRSLNDRGDGSPEGELMDDLTDIVAKFERAKITERTRRGRFRRAREGKVVPGNSPHYGFQYNPARDNYVIDESAMTIVRRIFREIGVEGKTIHGVKRTLDREGVPTPSQALGWKKPARYWSQAFVRSVILDDIYKPHTSGEMVDLVAPEVASRLARDKCYGVYWYNRNRAILKPGYRKSKTVTRKPKEEWIAVPVPDAGVPREQVEAAREAIRHNRRPANSGKRFWELSGGLLRCSDCGYGMATHSGSKQRYSYYVCQNRECLNKGHRAEPLEGRVAEFVRDLLHNPEKLKAHADELMERERRILGNPEQAAKVWRDKLATIEQMRRNYQHQHAAGLMTLEELGKELAELEADRRIAEQELANATAGRERMEELKGVKSFILGIYGGMVAVGLEFGIPEVRYEVYNRLRLRAVVDKDGRLEVTGAFENNFLPNDFKAAHDAVRGFIEDNEEARYRIGPQVEEALSLLNDFSE